MSEILVVDDDPFSMKLTSFVIEQAGYTPLMAGDATSALMLLRRRHPDLLLLDVGLPVINGFELCRQVRRISDVPIIFVSGRADLEDRVMGLQLGGDDYLTKPYETAELLARIVSVLRRHSRDTLTAYDLLTYGDLTLDPHEQLLVLGDGRRCSLSPNEFRLLHYLMRNPGQVLTTEQILQAVWRESDTSNRNLVAAYVHRLRRKIEQSSARPCPIATVSDQGYCFAA